MVSNSPPGVVRILIVPNLAFLPFAKALLEGYTTTRSKASNAGKTNLKLPTSLRVITVLIPPPYQL
jgi:hypothetical protein